MPAPKTQDGPRIKKEPTKLRQPIDGHILLEEKSRYCLYFVTMPPTVRRHSLCRGYGSFAACPDFQVCNRREKKVAPQGA